MADPYGVGGAALSAAFWGRLAAGQFTVQRCGHCGRLRFPPVTLCPNCRSVAVDWVPVSGVGTVWSYTVVHRAPSPELADAVPYTLAVVALTEGPMVLGRVEGDGMPGGIAVGKPVTLVVDSQGTEGPARYHFEATPLS